VCVSDDVDIAQGRHDILREKGRAAAISVAGADSHTAAKVTHWPFVESCAPLV
jgi:hypothetical protein